MKRFFMCLLVFALSTGLSNAGSLQIDAPTNAIWSYSLWAANVTNYTAINPIIVNIPPGAFVNTSYIDNIQFACGRTFLNDSPTPDYSLIVKVFEGNAPTLYLHSTYSIPNNACTDYPALVSLSLNPDITNLGTGIAIGFFATNTAGAWYILGDISSHPFAAPHQAYYTRVTDIYDVENINAVNYLTNDILRYATTRLYGGSVIPTPTPYTPPTSTPYSGTPIPGSGDLPGNNPHDSPYNPNSTTSPYSVIPNGSGFDSMLRANGQCGNSTACTAGDMVIWLENYIELFWWIGLLCMIIRFYSLGD